MTEDSKNIKKKLAIVILAYADYESLELALATHSKFSVNHGVPIFILQNGRGTYDCERTYAVAKRYQQLFPKIIKVIDDIRPGIPYYSLKMLFNSERFNKYDYIIKLDDDVLVLTDNWIDKLCSCYVLSKEKYGQGLAYVTSLVNNNPYGFNKIIEYSSELSTEYFLKIAREHVVGPKQNKIVSKDMVVSGANGTIWGYPYIARWLHTRTTMKPNEYIKLSEKLMWEEVDNNERYSINCMLFEKSFWSDVYIERENDDEHMCHMYCSNFNKKIIANLNVPMIHLFFFSQRSECKDMLEDIRNIYIDFLKLNFPISICTNRLIELENRLRFLENSNKLDNYLKSAFRNFIKNLKYRLLR